MFWTELRSWRDSEIKDLRVRSSLPEHSGEQLSLQDEFVTWPTPIYFEFSVFHNTMDCIDEIARQHPFMKMIQACAGVEPMTSVIPVQSALPTELTTQLGAGHFVGS